MSIEGMRDSDTHLSVVPDGQAVTLTMTFSTEIAAWEFFALVQQQVNNRAPLVIQMGAFRDVKFHMSDGTVHEEQKP